LQHLKHLSLRRARLHNRSALAVFFARPARRHSINSDMRRRPPAHCTALKKLIHEEFGNGIMSAVDFSMDIVRQPDPKGDRVNVVLSGKFFPYKTY
jgi:hypothetical protein